jgi:arylsulfatase A-like enzyme
MYPPSGLQLRENVTGDKLKDIKEELQRYYAHCTATDEAIGNLIKKIKALGLYDNSVIIFTTDHGEMMGSHGVRPKDKQIYWDESAKVPFLIRYPGIGSNAGKETFTPFTTPDILPTMLSLTHVGIPKSIEGDDISSVVKNPGKQKDRAALFMSVYPTAITPFPEYRAIKTSRYTYIKTPEKAIMLFDNIADPYEMNNLLNKPEYSKLQDKMEKLLQQELKAIGDQDFKTYQYYLDKFGFSDIGEKKGEVPYSIDPCQLTRVFTPRAN